MRKLCSMISAVTLLPALAACASNSPTVLVARDSTDGAIVGTATLITYRVSSGLKGRLEDVIVDESARGRGVGEALTREVMTRANDAQVLMLELTSMPYRETANRLYKRLGFVRKPTNVYVWWPR